MSKYGSTGSTILWAVSLQYPLYVILVGREWHLSQGCVSQGGFFPRRAIPKGAFSQGNLSQGGIFPRLLFPKVLFPRAVFPRVLIQWQIAKIIKNFVAIILSTWKLAVFWYKICRLIKTRSSIENWDTDQECSQSLKRQKAEKMSLWKEIITR